MFDWGKYAVGGARRPDSFTGLNSNFSSALSQMLLAAESELGPNALTITSAYRSPAKQAELYKAALKKYGSEAAARKWVAPPGRSMHNKGLAVDFAASGGGLLRDANSREAQWIKANAARFGLDVPMSWEPWQVELAGARGGAFKPSASQAQSTATSTQGVAPMMQQEEKPRGLLGGLGIQKMQEGAPGETGQRFFQRDSFKDTAALLAQGFGRMGIMGMEEIADDIAKQRTESKAKNKTVEYLRKAGRDDLADAVANNVLGGSAAASLMFKEPKEKFTQVKGSAIGLTGPQADRMFNVSANGKITAIGGSAPVTNVNTPAGETAWSKGIGEFGVETFKAINKEASSAQDMLSNTVVLENLMQDPDFTSGALVEPKMAYKKVIEALGGEAANVGSLEAFRAVTSKLILDQMGGSLGAGFSEGDRKFVEGMGAQLSTSIQGNKMIIQMNRKIGKRKLEIAAFADKYIQENGNLGKEFMGALRKWSKENPLFKSINPSAYLED